MNKKAQISEALESPGFWLLGGGAVLATIGGYILSKKAGWTPLPLWQLAIMIVIEIIAAGFFVLRE